MVMWPPQTGEPTAGVHRIGAVILSRGVPRQVPSGDIIPGPVHRYLHVWAGRGVHGHDDVNALVILIDPQLPLMKVE